MSAPPEHAKGATPRSRAQRKTLAKAFDDAGIVKSSQEKEAQAWQR